MANSRNSGSENSRSPLFLRQVEECLIVFLTNYQRLIVSETEYIQLKDNMDKSKKARIAKCRLS